MNRLYSKSVGDVGFSQPCTATGDFDEKNGVTYCSIKKQKGGLRYEVVKAGMGALVWR